jgi:hypothetical protein
MKNKLKLEKFKISELKNSNKIFGGNALFGDGTGSDPEKEGGVCVKMSDVIIHN